MSQILKLQEKARALMTEARQKADVFKDKPDEMPQTVADEITSLLGKFDEAKASISALEALEVAEGELDQPVTQQGKWREGGPGEGDQAYDGKSWREVEVKTTIGEKRVRYYVPEKVNQKGYEGAFESYIRRGYDRLGPNDRKTLSVGVDSAGGFLAPAEFIARLIQKLATFATVRNLATVNTTSRDIVQFPRVNYTADDKYTSGVRMTWIGGEIPASATAHRSPDPTIGMLSIPVHTQMASTLVTNQLLEDSAFDIDTMLSEKYGEALALGENDKFINGTGDHEPQGLWHEIGNTDTLRGVQQVLSGIANGIIDPANPETGPNALIDVYMSIPSQYRMMAQWLMNSATASTLMKARDVDERQYGLPNLLQNRPSVIDEFVEDVGDGLHPIMVGDFSAYWVFDRVGLSVQRNPILYAETDMTVIIARKRTGGAVLEPWRLRALKSDDA